MVRSRIARAASPEKVAVAAKSPRTASPTGPEPAKAGVRKASGRAPRACVSAAAKVDPGRSRKIGPVRRHWWYGWKGRTCPQCVQQRVGRKVLYLTATTSKILLAGAALPVFIPVDDILHLDASERDHPCTHGFRGTEDEIPNLLVISSNWAEWLGAYFEAVTGTMLGNTSTRDRALWLRSQAKDIAEILLKGTEGELIAPVLARTVSICKQTLLEANPVLPAAGALYLLYQIMCAVEIRVLVRAKDAALDQFIDDTLLFA
jgi:hypothetical protein